MTGSDPVSDCCRAPVGWVTTDGKTLVCGECEEHCQEWDGEPTDDQIYNGFGMEGGIAYMADDDSEWRGYDA